MTEYTRMDIIDMLLKADYSCHSSYDRSIEFIRDNYRVIVKFDDNEPAGFYLLSSRAEYPGRLMTTIPYGDYYLCCNVSPETFMKIVVGPSNRIMVLVKNEITKQVLEEL